MTTKTKLVKRIFSSLLTAALAVPMTALTAHATGEAFFYPPKNPVRSRMGFTSICEPDMMGHGRYPMPKLGEELPSRGRPYLIPVKPAITRCDNRINVVLAF